VLVILREEYCWLVACGWFVLREKYCWLVGFGAKNGCTWTPNFCNCMPADCSGYSPKPEGISGTYSHHYSVYYTKFDLLLRGEIIGRYGGPYVPYVRVGHEWHPEDRQGQASSLGREDEITKVNSDPMHFCGHRDAESFVCHLYKSSRAHSTFSPYSFGLSATSQQYFSLRTNQPPAISQRYFSGIFVGVSMDGAPKRSG
jgi:hypothetical protein